MPKFRIQYFQDIRHYHEVVVETDDIEQFLEDGNLPTLEMETNLQDEQVIATHPVDDHSPVTTGPDPITIAVHTLRDLGCAVVVWTPDEVGDANIDHLEDIMIQRGNEFLS